MRSDRTLCVCADEGRDSSSRSSSVTRSSADCLSSNRSSLVVSSSRILCCSLMLSDPVPPFIPILRNFLFDSSSFSRSRRSHRPLYLSSSFFMLFTWSWPNENGVAEIVTTRRHPKTNKNSRSWPAIRRNSLQPEWFRLSPCFLWCQSLQSCWHHRLILETKAQLSCWYKYTEAKMRFTLILERLTSKINWTSGLL